jgi:hypothetical protein
LVLKRCNKCGEEFPVTTDYFTKYKNSKDGFYYTCKTCQSENRTKSRKKNGRKWHENILNSIHSRAKVTNKSDEIDRSFLIELKNRQNGMCYWFNIPIDFTMQDKLRRPSIDRLDNSKGYTKDNVVLTTQFANLGRQSESVVNFRLFLEKYIKNNSIE